MSLLEADKTAPLEGGPSFSLTNRLARVAWGLSWALLARWTPPPLHAWRRLLLRAFGADIHPTARVHASVSIWLPANLRLGAHCLIGPGAKIYNQGHIAIGDYTVVSQGAYICASSHDVRDPAFQLLLRPISIGNRCWIAADAFVGPGVTVNDRAVLAARAALFTNAEADGIYRGNPATLVRQRKLRGHSPDA